MHRARAPADPAALLRWFDVVQRRLPWRETRDPYRILVSELMLQQTRVETVRGRYLDLVATFPSFAALAAAEESEVLAAWSGLGYYRRARDLRRACQEIVARGFPTTRDGLARLPGVGRYTAAAVASIAFDEVVPALDGNVARVTSRLLGSTADPTRRAVRQRLEAEASRWLDAERPGASNQALMEIGATRCHPRAPNCSGCPLAGSCRGRLLGRPESFPARRRKRPRVRESWRMFVVEREGWLLLRRRDAAAPFLAGMWELPWEPIESSGSTESRSKDRGARFRHAITYRDLDVEVVRAGAAPAACGAAAEWRWASPSERAQLPRTAMIEKALGALARGEAEEPVR